MLLGQEHKGHLGTCTTGQDQLFPKGTVVGEKGEERFSSKALVFEGDGGVTSVGDGGVTSLCSCSSCILALILLA